jgi:hypothetical protein
LQPFLLRADDNPEGLEKAVLDGFAAACTADAPPS